MTVDLADAESDELDLATDSHIFPTLSDNFFSHVYKQIENEYLVLNETGEFVNL